MTRKNLFFTIILLIVFITTSMLALITAKKITKARYPYSTNAPDFFMHTVTYTKFNREGTIQNQVKAGKIIHFSKNNTYFFDNPDMMIYTLGEEPWHITANKGKSEQGKSVVDIWDNVKIVRAAGVNNTDFDIITTQLTVYPNERFAQTEQPVTIVQNGSITKAVGARADFKTGIIKLISKIESWLQIK